MLSVLPFVVLLTTSFVILILGRNRSRMGWVWMISTIVSLLTWLGVILLHIQFPNGFTVQNWLPGRISQDVLTFQISESSWVLAVIWLSLLVCVIAVSSANLENENSVLILSGSFAMAAVTLLSIESMSLLGFLITWTLIDMVEFILLARTIPEREMMRTEIIDISIRIAGTFLVVAALAISSQRGGGNELTNAGADIYTLLIAGSALRMGVLPLHTSFTPDEPVRRTLGTLYRLATLVSAFALLVQLPGAPFSQEALWFVYFAATVAAVFGALMWATAVNELSGRQYWALSLAGLGILAVMRGQSSLTLAAVCILITVGGFLFATTLRERRHTPLLILLLLSATGLPFTPFSSAWTGEWSLLRIVQILTLALLLIGAERFYQKKNESNVTRETWISFFTRLGMIVISLAPWTVLIWNRDFLPLQPGWWYALILVGLFAAGWIYRIYFSRRLAREDRATQFTRDLITVSARSLRVFFRFDWLFKFMEWSYRQMRQIILFLENTLEGDGGVLWSLVFLALLISVLVGAAK